MDALETIEIGPETATATVIWMHGLGADGHDFEPIVPELRLGPDVRFIFPHASRRPVTINGGFVMRAWYDILELGGKRQDEGGLRESSAQIEALIENENKRGVPTNRIILAGFSQGGAMTYFTGLRYKEAFAGLVILSGYLPLEEIVAAERNATNLDVPMFIGHGSVDPMVPVQLGKMSCNRVQEWSAHPEWNAYPIPHSVSPQEIADIAAFMQRVLGV